MSLERRCGRSARSSGRTPNCWPAFATLCCPTLIRNETQRSYRYNLINQQHRKRTTMKTERMTVAQAIVAFLKRQFVERDGQQNAFFSGVLGIFGHGNVAGIGEALLANPDLPYTLVRNEQAAVHMAAGYAKASNRLKTFACTSSIGPGATNMVTGAALATINRLP